MISKQRRRPGVFLVAVIVAAIGLAGVVVVKGGTSILEKSCKYSTKLDNEPGWEFTGKEEVLDIIGEELPAVIEDLPGVTELVGGIKLSYRSEIVEGFGGDILIGSNSEDDPRARRFTSINPQTGVVSWSRTNPGYMEAPQVVGENLVTFSSVKGGKYRIMVLDGATGKVKGCTDLERDEHSGLYDAPYSITLDGKQIVAVSQKRDTGMPVVTSIELSSLEEKWQVAVPPYPSQKTVTSFEDTIVLGHSEEGTFSGGNISVDENGEIFADDMYKRIFTGLDSETGKEKWVWPKKQAENQYVNMSGEPVLGQTGDTPLVVMAESMTYSQDSQGETDKFIVALNPDTGEELWEIQESFFRKRIVGNTVVLAGVEEMIGVDIETGKTMWTQPIRGEQDSPPDSPGLTGIPDLELYGISWGNLVMALGPYVPVFDAVTGKILANADWDSRIPTNIGAFKKYEPDFLVERWWATPGALTVTLNRVIFREPGQWLLCFGHE